MSRQRAASVLSEQVFENETLAGEETGREARLAATTHNLTVRKGGPPVDDSAHPIHDNDVVIWTAADFATGEKLEIVPLAADAGLFNLSNTSDHVVRGTIGDGKTGGKGTKSAHYSVVLVSGGVRRRLFRVVRPFTDDDPEPYLVIDSIGKPPGSRRGDGGPRH